MIRKVLVANRGEIARRVIRAAHSLGISTVSVHSDADSKALYVQEADEAVCLPGNTAADTYLVPELLLQAAASTDADAVHPGYGFLSENARFAAACETAGLTFVGPPAQAIALMGDKLGAKEIMARSGVPTLVSITVSSPDEAGEDLLEALSQVGIPAIIKASAGGGGRGMRIVTDPSQLIAALESARREAEAAFGDPTVFIERYLAPARHIEVQVVADQYGGAAALFERECSIQRRHQKLVEESPSPFVDEEMRARLTDAAVRAVQAVDYRGVGTVEFVAGPDRTFAFLEMNTRLQVEHPVTELVTGLDLVRLQFKVAGGEALGPDVTGASIKGHAIEVRLCAEDPAAGYLPASGTFSVFEVGGEGIRLDSGVTSGSEVPPYYDSMVAKVVAHGENRAEAASKLGRALASARIHGVTTNRDLLVRILRSSQFGDGDTTTDFLERVPGLTEPLTSAAAHRVHAVAAAVALRESGRADQLVQASIPAGWRNNRSSPATLDLDAGGDIYSVHSPAPSQTMMFGVNGTSVSVELHSAGADLVDMTVDAVRRRYLIARAGGQVLVDSGLGSSSFSQVPRFILAEEVAPAGGLNAPMPGRVVRTMVRVGQIVEAGQALLVLEAMKMEHTISSPTAGTVTSVNVSDGDQVERGAVLAAVEAADPDPDAITETPPTTAVGPN